MAMLQDPSKKYRPFAPVHLRDRSWPDATITRAPTWCSVDLRDGNQALIEPMNAERKLRMFQQLVKVGFKQIEVGFPSASQTEFDFIRGLIEQKHIPDDVTIQILTQSREPLIRRSFEALKGARRAIVHFYNAVAPVMRRVVFNMNLDEVVELAVTHARLIKQLAEENPETEWHFEYSPEMFSGTELEFSRRIVDAVSEVFQPTPQRPLIVNLPSTVEHSTPNIFADMVEWMHRNLQRRDSIVLSIHPHNDRGTGTAAGEFALMAGADRIEGCLFGNGERTGNVDVVNMALNMYTQGVHPQLDFSDIDEIRRTVEYCNQLPVGPRHPYVGDLVFTSFSGSHQDAIKKAFNARGENDIWEMPYLPIDPLDLGRSYEAVIRVNSQSGKGGITYLLEQEFGLSLPRRLQIEFSQAVQQVMDDTGKEMSAADIGAIFQREYFDAAAPYGYVSHHLVEDSTRDLVELGTEVSIDGRGHKLKGQGNGPIDAFTAALSQLVGEKITVVDYHEHAITSGADAAAVTYIELKLGESRALFGVGRDSNIVTASLKAILSGLNRALAQRAAQPRKRVA
ncbi:2-isopropylmalate synthase [Solimonas aquatica]|uniref:2-isopropylmalate synthase n=2 Tax=Solimonas aquatica TaxID=489703 RepID=A0A1H9HV84_9GAMM|nr:2-isopropylmalate synthase [Solimonas aquatica]SEQ66187.1 2-isopropylmalate synthase [Solimonas aquatica]